MLTSDGRAAPTMIAEGAMTFDVILPTDGRWLVYATSPPAGEVYRSTLEVTGRAKLFEGNFDYEWVVASYDASRTGRELLLGRFTNPESELRIAVNWRQELRDRIKPTR